MSRQKQGKRLNTSDFYPTPSWCYKNLDIDWSQFSSAHEPCRGDSRIYDWLCEQNLNTTYSEIREDKDFLEWTGTTDLIITNPPFSLAQEFITKSCKQAETVIMLLRLNYLGSITRHEWWKEYSPTSLYVLSKRPSFTGKGTDATDYAWFVWDKTTRIPKGLHFVSPPTRSEGTADNASCAAALAALDKKWIED
tara:strand:- start:310 stop:891 length:582 start_codon:yes stop_codon:yes gene_type:complete